MNREVLDFVDDIIDAMTKAQNFVDGLTYKRFVEDEKTTYAVFRALEIIGEAVKSIPYSVRRHYPSIPWKEIAGLRDKLIHHYFGIKLDVIWETVNKEIPELKPKFENLRKDLKIF